MMHLKKILLLILIIKIFFLSFLSYSDSFLEVVIHTEKEKVNFLVEVATSTIKRNKGLMFRKALPRNKGMLLVFPYEKNIGIWMKNTFIPLDIIFISKDKVIKKIVRSATPLEKKVYFSDYLSKYALEINSGLTEKYNILEGNKIYFEKF